MPLLAYEDGSCYKGITIVSLPLWNPSLSISPARRSLSPYHSLPTHLSFTIPAKMRCNFAFFGLLATSACAAPEISKHACLDNGSANNVAQNFRSLIAAYTPSLADAVLAEDVHDYSDSVNTLISEFPHA